MHPLSLEMPVGQEGEGRMGDFIEDDRISTPADAAAAAMLREQIEEVLQKLPERERKVWRTILDHYVFDMNGDPAGHLPDHAKGIMGPADPKLFARMRHMLGQIYR